MSIHEYCWNSRTSFPICANIRRTDRGRCFVNTCILCKHCLCSADREVLGIGRSSSAPNAKIGTPRPASLVALREWLRKGASTVILPGCSVFRLMESTRVKRPTPIVSRGAVLARAAMLVPSMSPKSPLLPAQVGIGQVAVVSTSPESVGLTTLVCPQVQYSRHHSLRGARCSSVVRAFAHGAMGRRIDPSCGEPIELFLVPASAPRLM